MLTLLSWRISRSCNKVYNLGILKYRYEDVRNVALTMIRIGYRAGSQAQGTKMPHKTYQWGRGLIRAWQILYCTELTNGFSSEEEIHTIIFFATDPYAE